jgi:hypothetical protein
MNPHLKSLLRRHEKATLKEFHENGEIGPAKMLMENEHGHRLLVMMALDGEGMAKAGRDAIKGFGAVRYALCMESWFLLPGEHEGLNMRPSEHPLRHEGIWFHAEDIKGERATISYEIKRREGAKPWLEKMNVDSDPYATTGRLLDLFSEGPYL